MTQKSLAANLDGTDDGSDLISLLGDWEDALNSMHKGASRPTYAAAGMMWVDDSVTDRLILNIYTGSTDLELGRFDTAAGKFIANFTLGSKVRIAKPSAATEVDFDDILPDAMIEGLFFFTPSDDCNVGVQASNDDKVNWTKDSGDAEIEAAYQTGGTESNGSSTTVVGGISVDFGLPGGAGAGEHKSGHFRIMQDGSAVAAFVCDTMAYDTAGNLGRSHAAGILKNHVSGGITNVRIEPSGSATVTGVIVFIEHTG